MARGAFEVSAHEHLRDVLCGLHLAALAGVDGAAPLDALHKAGRVALAADQFTHKLVVRQVGVQRAVQPGGDLRATVVDEAWAEVGIAQMVVPKTHPMIGIRAVVLEQSVNEGGAFVGGIIGHEFF